MAIAGVPLAYIEMSKFIANDKVAGADIFLLAWTTVKVAAGDTFVCIRLLINKIYLIYAIYTLYIAYRNRCH